MNLRVGEYDGEVAVFNDDVDATLPELVLGPDGNGLKRQWAEWWVSKRTMPDDTVDWPLAGDSLQKFITLDMSVLYIVNGEPVGTLGWNGAEWWFTGLEFDGSSATRRTGGDRPSADVHGNPVAPSGLLETWLIFIDADPEASQRYREQYAEIQQMAESVQPPFMAELHGRMKVVRDDTFELADARASYEARKVWRARQGAGAGPPHRLPERPQPKPLPDGGRTYG